MVNFSLLIEVVEQRFLYLQLMCGMYVGDSSLFKVLIFVNHDCFFTHNGSS